MTMNRLTVAAVAICAIFQAQSSLASPMAPMATMTIDGTIQTIAWQPEKLIKGLPGMSGSAGTDRTVPAHYKLTLTDTKVASDGGGFVPFTSGKDIDTTLNHPKDDRFLKQGMKVRIINFRMSGDEGGIRTSFEKIEILGKNEAPAAGQAIAQDAKPQDWPQWRGPNRDGRAGDFKAPATWPKELVQKWKVSVGISDASPVAAGGKVYAFAREGGDEVTLCLSAADGKEVWRDKNAVPAFTGSDAGIHLGPRSTPAVAEGKVVTLGVTGVLTCLDAEKGTVAWRKEEIKGTPKFHTSSSPIIVEGLAIAQLGPEGTGAIVAYELATGKEKWQCANQGAAYASPVLATLEGVKQIVALTDKNVVGVSVADGKLLWSRPFAAGYNAATPIIAEGGVVIVSGMGRTGTKALKVSKAGDAWKVEEAWTNPLGVMYCTPVVKDGFLYAISDKGSMFCLNAKTGETVWTETTNKLGNYGAMLDAGGAVLALPNKPELLVVKPGEKQYTELARYKVGDGQVFACPAVAGGRIYVKDRDSVIAWALE